LPPSSASSDAAELQLLASGTIFHGRYEVVRCIKAGGMGAVYEVIHREVRRRQALKTMLPSLVSDPDMRARFRLEATVAAEIDSEHIVQVFDAGVDESTGLPFLVMELLKGESLAVTLEQRGPLPVGQVVELLGQASLALDRTHAAGIVHRDLKPENLFLTRRDDGQQRIKLLDFGIAKVVAQGGEPDTTRSFGTPLYMSPEQIRGDGDIGPRADLYSLGQIAFTLLTATAYWEPESKRSGGVYSLLLKVMAGPAEAATERARRVEIELPAVFDGWFNRATAMDPAERFASASELVAELAQTLGVPLPPVVKRAAGEASKIGSEVALAPTLESVGMARTPARSGEKDSTGALSSAARLVRRERRRTGALWVALLIIAGAGAALLVGRRMQAPPPVFEPSALPTPDRPAAPVPAQTSEQQRAPSAAPPPPSGVEIAPKPAASSERIPPPASSTRAAGAPRGATSVRKVAPASSGRAEKPAYDPTDIR
jgi:serine/threonine-protein kinase